MKKIIMLRHESLFSEIDSEVVVCDSISKQLVENAPIFKRSQDPYYLGKFRDSDGEFWQVIGMVRITVDSNGKITNWHDALYRYKDSVMELGKGEKVVEPWMVSIDKWKDLRFQQLGGEIIVTPRPQGGEFGGLGRVGLFRTLNLDTLQKDLEKFAQEQNPDTIIKGLFAEGHWGAVSQLLGRVGGKNLIRAIGHDATVEPDNLRHYISTYFHLNPDTLEVTSEVITVSTADNYPHVDPKPDHGLGKINFPAGVTGYRPHTRLITGVGDRVVGAIPINIRHLDKRLLAAA
jgi:Protein of unknown function (DUF1861)